MNATLRKSRWLTSMARRIEDQLPGAANCGHPPTSSIAVIAEDPIRLMCNVCATAYALAYEHECTRCGDHYTGRKGPAGVFLAPTPTPGVVLAVAICELCAASELER